MSIYSILGVLQSYGYQDFKDPNQSGIGRLGRYIYTCSKNQKPFFVKITKVGNLLRKWKEDRGELLVATNAKEFPNVNKIICRYLFDEEGNVIPTLSKNCYVADISDYIIGSNRCSLDLFKYVQAYRLLLEPDDLLDNFIDFGIQIAQLTLQFHRKGIVLRDLKCQNILVDLKKRLLSIDHELARKMDLELEPLTPVGTDIAPEVYDKEIQDKDLLDRIDSFSFGVILYYFVRKFELAPELVKLLQDGKINAIPFEKKGLDPVLADMIEMLLKRDPKERMPMIQAYDLLVGYKKQRELDQQKAIEKHNPAKPI